MTYFFNCGGTETPYKGEVRELAPAQQVATYDLAPEMSAAGVTYVLCKAIASRAHDFIPVNYANGYMAGHTGATAAIKAVECADTCLARVIDAASKVDARLIVTADHGNCEMMIDPVTGGPQTADMMNPVPIIVVDPDGARPLRGGGARRNGWDDHSGDARH